MADRALGTTPWDEPSRVTIERELWRLAQDVLKLGLSVVLDFGLWGTRRTRTSSGRWPATSAYGVELHYLEVSTDELWRRIEARNTEPPWSGFPISRAHLDEGTASFQVPDAAELALFDPPPPLDVDSVAMKRENQ